MVAVFLCSFIILICRLTITLGNPLVGGSASCNLYHTRIHTYAHALVDASYEDAHNECFCTLLRLENSTPFPVPDPICDPNLRPATATCRPAVPPPPPLPSPPVLPFPPAPLPPPPAPFPSPLFGPTFCGFIPAVLAPFFPLVHGDQEPFCPCQFACQMFRQLHFSWSGTATGFFRCAGLRCILPSTTAPCMIPLPCSVGLFSYL